MNVGEYLVSKSPLNSGTALAHLLAMQTGSVVGKTIFAAQMTVCVEEPQMTLVQRPAELSVSATREQTETTQKDKPNRITAMTRSARVDVTTRQAAIYVAQKSHVSTFVRTLPNTVTTRRTRLTTMLISGESNDSYSV